MKNTKNNLTHSRRRHLMKYLRMRGAIHTYMTCPWEHLDELLAPEKEGQLPEAQNPEEHAKS